MVISYSRFKMAVEKLSVEMVGATSDVSAATSTHRPGRHNSGGVAVVAAADAVAAAAVILVLAVVSFADVAGGMAQLEITKPVGHVVVAAASAAGTACPATDPNPAPAASPAAIASAIAAAVFVVFLLVVAPILVSEPLRPHPGLVDHDLTAGVVEQFSDALEYGPYTRSHGCLESRVGRGLIVAQHASVWGSMIVRVVNGVSTVTGARAKAWCLLVHAKASLCSNLSIHLPAYYQRHQWTLSRPLVRRALPGWAGLGEKGWDIYSSERPRRECHLHVLPHLCPHVGGHPTHRKAW